MDSLFASVEHGRQAEAADWSQEAGGQLLSQVPEGGCAPHALHCEWGRAPRDLGGCGRVSPEASGSGRGNDVGLVCVSTPGWTSQLIPLPFRYASSHVAWSSTVLPIAKATLGSLLLSSLELESHLVLQLGGAVAVADH